MQGAEIEIKFPVHNSADLEAQLPALGFHLETPRTFEHNTLYDTPARSLRERRQILRLRKYGDLCILTHKRTPENADDSRYKTRIETETLIGDCDAMAEVFKQLGYVPPFVYEKFRTEWATKPPSASGQNSKAQPNGSNARSKLFTSRALPALQTATASSSTSGSRTPEAAPTI